MVSGNIFYNVSILFYNSHDAQYLRCLMRENIINKVVGVWTPKLLLLCSKKWKLQSTIATSCDIYCLLHCSVAESKMYIKVILQV